MAGDDERPAEVNVALRGLLDVVKVALGPGGPELPQDEAGELLMRLLAVIDRTMPPDLQVVDMRVARARLVVEHMKQ
jgi:hypothetical protein